MNNRKPLRLMIPGPVTVHPEVLEALGCPVQPHYGPAFRDLYLETLGLVREVFNTTGDVLLMAGSGTAAIDASIGSLLQSGQKIIVGSNGFFGERLGEIAKSYGLEVVTVPGQAGTPLSPDAILKAVEANPDARAVAVVHLETSTTILNPINAIGKSLAGRGVYFIVDAVSSLGGVPFAIDDWHIDLCAAATQKCLGAPPGLAPVAISRRAWEEIDRQPVKGHGWFGDLRIWRKYFQEWGDWHPTPVTFSSNLLGALNVALHQLKDEGIEVRLDRYRSLACRLRAGLSGIGLELYTPEELMNPVLTAAWAPAGVPSGKIISYLETCCGIKISSGLGDLKEKLIRVGHMSPVVTESDIDDVVSGIDACLHSL